MEHIIDSGPFVYWDDWKKAKLANNRNSSLELIKQTGLKFEIKNNGSHLVVFHDDSAIDFWPSTGLWIFRKTKWKGRGVFNLLKRLKASGS